MRARDLCDALTDISMSAGLRKLLKITEELGPMGMIVSSVLSLTEGRKCCSRPAEGASRTDPVRELDRGRFLESKSRSAPRVSSVDFSMVWDSLKVYLSIFSCQIDEMKTVFWCTGFPGNRENRRGVVPDLVSPPPCTFTARCGQRAPLLFGFWRQP